LAALAGSSIGALASFATTWLNQSYQNRIQRHSNERARREKLFGDFINEAAAAYTDAMVNKLENPSGLVNLYAIKSRISLFSNEEVLLEADKVMQAITKKYYGEKMKYSEMNPDTVTQFDLLRDFTRSCRKEMTKY
jgi:ferredoxin-NADP reductase